MIKYEDISHIDGMAHLELRAMDKTGDLRPHIWNAMYGELREMLGEAASDIVTHAVLHDTPLKMSRQFPGIPRCLEKMAEALNVPEK